MAGRALKPRTPHLQRGHPLNIGLAGAWLITEGGGLRALDASGRANHATPQSPTFFISTGRVGPALDGGGLAVVAYTDKNYGSGSIFLNMTLSAWFNVPTATAGAQAPIIGLNDDQSGNSGTFDHLLYLDLSGHVGGYIYDGAAQTAVSTETFFDANWHHAVVTIRNGVEIVVWVDGVKRATTAIGAPFSGYATAYLVIGKTNTSQFSHVGKYDDFRVWSRPLQGQEIIALYNTDYREFQPPRQDFAFSAPAAPTGARTLNVVSTNMRW